VGAPPPPLLVPPLSDAGLSRTLSTQLPWRGDFCTCCRRGGSTVDALRKDRVSRVGEADHAVGGGESEAARAEGQRRRGGESEAAHAGHVHGRVVRRRRERTRVVHVAVHVAVVHVVRHGRRAQVVAGRREPGERVLVQRLHHVRQSQTGTHHAAPGTDHPVAALFLLRLGTELAVPRLDPLFFHCQRPIHLRTQK